MPEYAYEILDSVISATSSDLILFFIVLAVVAVPLYIVVIKGRKADKLHEREREKQIIEVITKNSTVIEGLKVTLESSGDASKSALERIHTRIDGQSNTLKEMSTDVAKIKTKMDNSLTNQTEMASKINKILLIVDKLPNNSNLSTNSGTTQKGGG